jgi:hypothetical protein
LKTSKDLQQCYGHQTQKIAFFISYAFILFIVLSIFGSRDAMSMVMDFDQFIWESRLLFLFASEKNDPRFLCLQWEISTRKSEVDDSKPVCQTSPSAGVIR